MRAFRWLLCRDALFRWMMPLFTMESMTGAASLNLAAAAALSPDSTAASTLLTAVRNLDRAAMLRARRLTVWWARFSADLILATERVDSKKEARILPIRGRQGKRKSGDRP